jgi:hypothetical protein
MFNVRDTQAQNWIVENPKISDSELIEKFISKEMGVVERKAVGAKKDRFKLTDRQRVGVGALAIFIIVGMVGEWFNDRMKNYDDRSDFIKTCQLNGGTLNSCERTEKSNKYIEDKLGL